MLTSEIASYSFGVIGIAIAIYQLYKAHQINQHIKTEVMGAYTTTAILLGKLQVCLQALESEDKHLGIRQASGSEGIAQTLLIDSIKNIHHHYNFTREDIDEWIKNGKIHDFHKPYFLKFSEK